MHRKLGRYNDGRLYVVEKDVVEEGACTIFVNGSKIVELSCSAFDLRELACGYLTRKGADLTSANFVSIELVGNSVWVSTSEETCSVGNSERACEELGRAAFFNPQCSDKIEFNLTAGDVFACMAIMEEKASRYRETGGLHCSALFDAKSLELLGCYEDVSRHSTIDKLLGASILERWDCRCGVLATTARINQEMLCMACKLHARVLLTRSTPTDQATEVAARRGIAIAGYVTRSSFMVFSDPEARLCGFV